MEVRALLRLLARLGEARASRKDVTLAVTHGELETLLHLTGGELVAVVSSRPGEPLGRIMRRERAISPDHYVEVLEHLKDIAAAGESARFGEIAVGLGYAAPEAVAACLALQVRGLVARVFQAETSSFTVRAPDPLRDRARDAPLAYEAILLECVRWLDDAERGRLGLDAARPMALEAAWSVDEILSRLELVDAEDADIVRRAVAGDVTVADLVREAAAGGLDASAIVTTLLAVGAVTARPRGAKRAVVAAPARAPAMSIPPAWATVDAREAGRAVEKIARARASRADLKAIGSLLERTLDAERFFQKGRLAFVNGDFASALRDFEQASQREPSSEEYGLFAEWTRRHVARARFMAEDVAAFTGRARRCLDVNPRMAFAHFVLGELATALGKKDEGNAFFEKALRLDAELFAGFSKRRTT